MITFLEFILESDFRSRLIPAIRNIGVPKTDKKHILKGKRGWTHQETAEHHGIDPDNRIKGELGYWDTGKHEFHPKHNSSYDNKEGINLDSTELDPRAGSVALMRRLEEGNPLAKVAKALENKGKRGKTSYMATISADRGGMSKSEKHEAHGMLQSAIHRHIKKGMLKMVGGSKQSGEYRYADPEPGEEGIAKEKSYVLAPGKHPKARGNFHRIMKKLGRDAGQESVLKVTQVGKKRPAGSLLYTTGPKTGTSEKVGRLHMNVDMPTGSGRTKFKNKDASIVVKENVDR
jgi:hypothetical protein